jgi:hypothetical protein
MDQNIYIIIVAIVVVSLDIVVRVFISPRRRDRFYQALLEMQAGVAAARSNNKRAQSSQDESLAQALLTYFQQSFTTRQVMAALATSADGVAGRELERQISERVAEQWNRQLSTNAIRRVIMILVGADLIEARNGKFALTNVGWNVFRKTKNASGPRWYEAPSRSPVHAH